MTKLSTTVQPSLSVLTPEQIVQVHHFSLEILSRVGLRVDSARALKFLSRAGAGTRVEGERVFIQPETVEWAINQRHPQSTFTTGAVNWLLRRARARITAWV